MQNEKGNLVRLLDVDSDFIIEMRYATDRNMIKSAIYDTNECYTDKNTAQLLIKARDIFKADGYRLKIWDAYRPLSVQKKLWALLPNDDYVAEPPIIDENTEYKPKHFNGLCVDVTLTDMDGNDLPMPTEYDDFTEYSGLKCDKIPAEKRKNAEYLRKVMESVGFQGYDSEWWHFYDVTSPVTPFSDYKIY